MGILKNNWKFLWSGLKSVPLAFYNKQSKHNQSEHRWRHSLAISLESDIPSRVCWLVISSNQMENYTVSPGN